ncbi:hypothetical protein LINPERPRIM_LOCUS28202 [Linum perenne]
MENSRLYQISFFAFILLTASFVSSAEDVCHLDEFATSLSSRKVNIGSKAGEGCKIDKDCCKICPPQCKGKQVEVQCFATGNCYCGC